MDSSIYNSAANAPQAVGKSSSFSDGIALKESRNFVNLGCGSRYHPAWINIDQWANDPKVIRHDLRHGIPLEDASADVVYHSHVLEHLSRKMGGEFLRECFRVLKKGGVIRVVVPNLEAIAELYLKALHESERGSASWQRNYEWMMLEMYDQVVREYTGGGISDYFRRAAIPNQEFVLQRIGLVGQHLMKSLSSEALLSEQSEKRSVGESLMRILERPSLLGHALKNIALRALLSREDFKALEMGRFRQSGDVHLWMYDRYSLAKALKDAGFVQPWECSALESSISGWEGFSLDADADGVIYKPDSLYMEAVKDL